MGQAISVRPLKLQTPTGWYREGARRCSRADWLAFSGAGAWSDNIFHCWNIYFFSIAYSIFLVENTDNYVRLQVEVWIFHKRKIISVSVFESQPAHCFSHFARLISEYMKKTAALAGSGAAPPSRPLPTARSSRFLVSLTLDFSLFIAVLCKMNNLVQILPRFLETIQGILPSTVYFFFLSYLDCTVIRSKHGTYLLSCTDQLGRQQKL